MRGVALVASSSRGVSVSQASTRAAAASTGGGGAGGCSSSGRAPAPSAAPHWRRRRLSDGKSNGNKRLSVVSLPPLAAAADGAFGGGAGDDEEDIVDPFGPADAALPPDVAVQMAAVGSGDSDGELVAAGAAAAAAAAAAAGEFASTSSSASEFESGGGQVRPFSRIGEKDPYRLLGVPKDASFEEIQDARNYLSLTYRSHERSREAVEGAFDAILKERMRLRHKLGFRPPKAGRKGDLLGDAPKRSLAARFQMLFDPTVTTATLVNVGSIFLALAVWAGWQANATDPTLPLLSAICYCGWRVFDKRRKLEPEPEKHFGGSPIWGALGTTLLALIGGFVLSMAFVRLASGGAKLVPLLGMVRPASWGLFVINLTLGAVCIFLR